MKLEFTLSRADHIAFNKTARGSWPRNWNLFIIIASTLAVLLLFNFPTAFWGWFGPFQSVVQIGLIFIGLFVLRKVVKRKTEEKYDAEFADSTFADPITLTFDENGLTSEQTHQKTIWKWSAFHKVSVEDGSINLWFGRLQAVVIPARAIGSDKQLTNLVENFRTKIG